jgi:hypothetical protein
MKKNIYIVIVCLLFVGFSNLSAQVTISGVVTDEKSQAIPFASIALVAAKDSHLVKGALATENGSFTIENVSAGDYRILASSVGFEKAFSTLFTLSETNKSATIDLTLKEASKLLSEAVVTAARPLFEQKADRLVVNVANSPIAAGGTALEILQKVPGVLVIQDKVTLAGNANVQVWIDGKPSPYIDVNAALRDMPGDQIDRIELITQPGARYDAAGGPILNIILKRNAELGLSGSAQLTLGGFRYNQSDVNGPSKVDYYRLNPALSLNYRSGKWNLFGNAAYNTGTYFNTMSITRFIGSENYKSVNLDESRYVFQTLRVGADYYATPKTTFGLLAKVWQRNGYGDALGTTVAFNQDYSRQLTAFTTENLANSKRANVSTNFNIKHDFNAKTGHSLNFDIDYNHFSARNINDLAIYLNTPNAPRSLSQQDVDQPVDLWVGKIDYTFPIDTSFKVETGIKNSFAVIDNTLNFYRSGELSKNESNTFLYTENVNALYLNANKKIGKLEFNAGIRTEQTRATGTSATQRELDRNYWQWFPNASLLYRLNKQMGIQAAYSKRVQRPSFQQQNPFVSYIDSLTYTRGNPLLRPEIEHTGQLSVVFDGQPFASIAYSRTDDVIFENAPKLEGTKTFTTADNLAEKYNWTFQLNFPIKFKKWLSGFGGNQAVYNAYDAAYSNTTYKASRWHWLAYWGVTANLPQKIKIELNGFYMTKFLEEFITINPLNGFNIGASKSFWDGRGKLSLNFNDVFYGQQSRGVISFNNVNVDFAQRNFSRNLRLNFSYQFGNTKVKSARSRKTGSESETSRVKVE